jgi:hypothetical protein
MNADPKLPRELDETTKPLTDADRIALASTALSILRLPALLQRRSDAFDMLDILAGDDLCLRVGYLLHQAHDVLNAYSSFQLNRHEEVDWSEEARAEVGKLVADALAKRRELIAEQEPF